VSFSLEEALMRHRAPVAAAVLTLALGTAPLSAALREGFGLAVVVDGCEAPEFLHDGKLYVEALRGRNFTLRLSNPTAERVAVALSVDGRNVVDAKRTTAAGAAKWILSPGQTVEIPGWQVSGETSRRFFFTETSRSYAKWLGDTRNVGTIEAVFYRERRPEPAPVAEGQAGSLEERDERPLRMNAPPAAAGNSRERRAEKSEADRFAATGIGDRTQFPVRWIEFDEEPDPAARIALRYEFHRELVRLGVLAPLRDGLAARERSRGFEPGYAPDPDGNR
jgi:hypothetical protein